MTITLLLVDDHPVVRSGLRAVLETSEDLHIVGEAGNGEDAVAGAQRLAPTVVLCDLRLGAGMDGVQTTKRLRELDPAPAVLILTSFDRDVEILAAIEAGAAGYLLKEETPDTIIEAIRTAANGQTYLPPELATRVVRQFNQQQSQPALTNREVEVLQLIATGASNQQIAQDLFVTEATVKSHLVHIFNKLGARSRSHAVHLAQSSGVLNSDTSH